MPDSARSRFVLRPVRREDLPQLLELIQALAAFERLSHWVECTLERLDDALFRPDASVAALLAWPMPATGNRAAGFALYFYNFSTFLGRHGLYLEDLYVRPEYRGRGCGTALLTALAHRAHVRGCGRFEWSVLDWNCAAQGFYRSLGATVLPDWRIVRLTGEPLARLAARHRDDRPEC
jgi:GNAT superfamily N-acetyltransferase